MVTSKAKHLTNMYVGAKAIPVRDRILKAIEEEKPYPGLYLITFTTNDTDQLDIISSRFLLRKNVREHLPVICGAAIGRKEAFETVAMIARDAYRATGNCDLRNYLLSIQDEEEN